MIVLQRDLFSYWICFKSGRLVPYYFRTLWAGYRLNWPQEQFRVLWLSSTENWLYSKIWRCRVHWSLFCRYWVPAPICRGRNPLLFDCIGTSFEGRCLRLCITHYLMGLSYWKNYLMKRTAAYPLLTKQGGWTLFTLQLYTEIQKPRYSL